MENFNQKQYEQATPIPAKFLLPDGTVVDTLPTSGGQGDVYSTEETVIGTWIDGKPIYRKVINITPKSFNSWEYIDETDNLNIDKVIKSVLFGTESSSFTDVMENAVVRRYENRKFAFITIGYTFQANTLLIEYTKTTD